MKVAAILLAAASLGLASAPGFAQAAAAKHYTTAETTIGTLLEDPVAKAVVDKHIPGLSENPSITMASGMTLAAIQPMSGDAITEKMLAAIDADLAKLPAK